MAERRPERRLAAILAADVVGYSRLMGKDEAGTLAQLKTLRKEVFDPRIADHNGRVVKTMGDGVLVEFASAVDAKECALKIQHTLARRNEDVPLDHRIELRIGINVGDVIVDGNDIYGDGVNVAARLEALCDTDEIVVSTAVRSQVEGKIAAVFEDLGEHLVKNIEQPIRVFGVSWDMSSTSAGFATKGFDSPAVAVLPFENMSGDPEQEYFADGLTEDIITALSLWRSFPVIARNSSFAYKGQSPDIRKVGRELGARYVIEGSVRKAGGRVRITAQLIDAQTGHHIWAEQYDRELEDIFELQDEITLRIAAIIEPAIEHSEEKRLAAKAPKDLGAWDLCIQGFSQVYLGTKEANATARAKFEQAIALDSDYARAWTGLAYTYFRAVRLKFTDAVEASIAKGVEAARRAVMLDDTDSDAHVMLSRAFNINGQAEDGLAEIRRAVEINPQNSLASWTLGVFLYLNRRAEEGIPWIEKALDINPLDPRNYIVRTHLAVAKICVGNYEEAAKFAREATRQRSDYIESHVVLATALGYLDRTDEAIQAVGEFRNEARDYAENHQFWGNETKRQFLEGLRRADLLD